MSPLGLPPVPKPVAIILDQLAIWFGLGIRQFAQRQRDDLAVHPGLAENAVHLVDHRFVVGITEADDFDPFGVAVFGPVFGYEREDQILRQMLVVGSQRFDIDLGQRIVAR